MQNPKIPRRVEPSHWFYIHIVYLYRKKKPTEKQKSIWWVYAPSVLKLTSSGETEFDEPYVKAEN